MAETSTPMTTHEGVGHDLQVGDFLDRSWRVEFTGPQGGRYYERAYRFESAIADLSRVRVRGIPWVHLTLLDGRTARVHPDQKVQYRRAA